MRDLIGGSNGMTSWFLAVPVIVLASYAATALVRRWALRRAVLDVPNERSSHSSPTPRGGGLVIAASALGAGCWAVCLGK